MRWVARIEDLTPDGFSDRQVRGPFLRWRHRHTFKRVSETETDIVDEIEAELRRHLLWWLVGALMWAGMPLLFAYRGWRTRRLLMAGTA